jgi:DNA-binding SARP family transcriptional activator
MVTMVLVPKDPPRTSRGSPPYCRGCKDRSIIQRGASVVGSSIATVRFQILGSVRVSVDGGELAITAGRDRVLLGVLLLYANESVSRDRLIDAVWQGKPPRDARNQLQGCVSRLRKRLGAAGFGRVIVTEPDGYRLAVDSGDVDLLEFRRLVGRARDAAGDGRSEEAAADYRRALGLWRGPALAGIDGHTIPRAAATLDEERLQALAECLDAQLAAGAGGELVAELNELVGQYPHAAAAA